MSLLNIIMAAASVVKNIELIGLSSKQNTNNSSTLVINKPAGTQQGDLMIVFMCEEGSNYTFTGDTGWTEIADQGSRPNLRIAYKVAGASEPSSYTFTSSNNNHKMSGSILTYRNAAFDVIGNIATGANPLVADGITVTLDNSLLLGFFIRDVTSYTISTPAGMSQVVIDNDSTACSYGIFSQSVNSGATGTRSATVGNTSNVSGVLLALKPA